MTLKQQPSYYHKQRWPEAKGQKLYGREKTGKKPGSFLISLSCLVSQSWSHSTWRFLLSKWINSSYSYMYEVYIHILWPCSMWNLSSLTRDQTHTPALELGGFFLFVCFCFLNFLFCIRVYPVNKQCCNSFRWTAKRLTIHTHVSILPPSSPPVQAATQHWEARSFNHWITKEVPLSYIEASLSWVIFVICCQRHPCW